MTGEGTVSEWMKIMLEEIARKKAEQDQMRAEEERRREEGLKRVIDRGCVTVRAVH